MRHNDSRGRIAVLMGLRGVSICGVLGADDLPENAEELRQLVLKQRAALAERDDIIERLKAQLTWLRRQQFGRSSEKIEREIAQLELQLEDLEETSSARRAVLRSCR